MNYTSPAPAAYILEERKLRTNLELIQSVQQEAGVSIILALKGFAMWSVFPFVKRYLSGATASSLHEARLIFEEMGCRAHTYAVAYLPDEFEEMMRYSSHITFNSVAQYRRYAVQLHAHPEKISAGIRVNPEYSEVEVAMYNPCAPGSRLGEVSDAFAGGLPEGVEGLHFHTLCESSSFDLEKVLAAFEERFGRFLPQLKWVNFGGGHLMTRKGYDTAHLVALLHNFRRRYPHLEVILEPGSAIAWETGVLTATVLDIVESRGVKTAILDVSFTAHMPDTLEMPYRPRVRGAADPTPGKPSYRLGGVSCLAGDYMLEYSFDKALQPGDRIVFEDMIHYTMVKTTMFNGVRHPDICILRETGELDIVRRFRYEDYRDRLS
ncbi:MAG: carboxynorspermidine decarboxylase [Saprospiraceae bacterium]|nr:carboxynorspermidine decarboxylase [Saprospiraceae bacterium]